MNGAGYVSHRQDCPALCPNIACQKHVAGDLTMSLEDWCAPIHACTCDGAKRLKMLETAHSKAVQRWDEEHGHALRALLGTEKE